MSSRRRWRRARRHRAFEGFSGTERALAMPPAQCSSRRQLPAGAVQCGAGRFLLAPPAEQRIVLLELFRVQSAATCRHLDCTSRFFVAVFRTPRSVENGMLKSCHGSKQKSHRSAALQVIVLKTSKFSPAQCNENDGEAKHRHRNDHANLSVHCSSITCCCKPLQTISHKCCGSRSPNRFSPRSRQLDLRLPRADVRQERAKQGEVLEKLHHVGDLQRPQPLSSVPCP